MHDGSLKTLEEVIAFYNKGGAPNQWPSKGVRPLNLTAAEQKRFSRVHGSANGASCDGSIKSPKTARVA
jgi:cytochrome c peroxidase